MVPYSIVTGVGSVMSGAGGNDDLKLWSFASIPRDHIRAPYCWINSWLAEQIEATPGDWIQLQFYEPETADGQLRQTQVRLLVVGIVPLTRPIKPYSRNRLATFDQAPTRFNDPDFTPTVDGITDQNSISNWDVPFELELRELILPQDDQYWEEHRLTPKVFVPLAYAQRVFGSRFGSTTAIHLTADDTTDEQQVRSKIQEGLLSVRSLRGWNFQTIRTRQLQSATGTTPFDWLFLSLSSFVIIAALMLVALLFQLAVQQRTAQLGVMLSQGFQPSSLRRLILGEMFVVAIVGAGVGVLLGLGYAKLMVMGLQSWWIGAISTRFLQFSFSPGSLCFGGLAGMLASTLTIQLVLRQVTRLQPLSLMQAGEGRALEEYKGRSTVWWAVSLFSALAALLLLALAVGQLGMARAGFFFGSGMLLLASALLAVRQWLSIQRQAHHPEKQGLVRLAFRAMVRNPVRSSLSISLLAVASFLIASMSVFQVSPNPQGYGGFDLLGVSTQPIYENLGSPRARIEAIGTPAEQLLGTTIIPLRMRQGDDASCTNLFQVAQPTILGLSQRLQKLNELTSRFRFSWAATVDANAPWMVLQSPGNGTPENPVPVILDQNTAMWSLKQGGQLQSLIRIEMDGRVVHLRVVGLLSNSVLQGKLIISERNFEYLFPQISGYRFFFIHSGQRNGADTVAAVLEKGWGDAGLDVTSSVDVLKRLLGVQNTYISAFQSLGALGLLLGTLGLIAAQIRSIIERRRELALMQAVGFSPWRIGRLLSLECALLLIGGLLIGVGCAAVALVPYVIEFGPQINVIHSLLMLAIVLTSGLLAAVIAVRYALRLPLLRSLRGS
jgi:ABC-type antimicrobial peptide transport system permease subunit